jgi:hypothetical protein
MKEYKKSPHLPCRSVHPFDLLAHFVLRYKKSEIEFQKCAHAHLVNEYPLAFQFFCYRHCNKYHICPR